MNASHNATLELLTDCGVSSLFALYRSIYKSGVGLTIGFLVRHDVGQDNGESGPAGACERSAERWLYCDDLHQVCLDDVEVMGASVGSIVEGVDACAETIELLGDDLSAAAFWRACDDVEKDVESIWKETHGCDRCAELADHIGPWGPVEGYDGLTPIRADCDNPDCMGEGCVI